MLLLALLQGCVGLVGDLQVFDNLVVLSLVDLPVRESRRLDQSWRFEGRGHYCRKAKSLDRPAWADGQLLLDWFARYRRETQGLRAEGVSRRAVYFRYFLLKFIAKIECISLIRECKVKYLDL